MDNRITKIVKPSSGLFLFILLVFAAITAKFDLKIAAIELVVCLSMFFFSARQTAKKKKEMLKYFEKLSINVNNASKDTITNFPLPVVIATVGTGEILWCNEGFISIVGEDKSILEHSITDIVENFDTKWLLEGKRSCPDILKIGDKYFSAFGNLVRSSSSNGSILMAVYFEDCTETVILRQEKKDTALVVSIIAIDNYEELLSSTSESEKSSILAEIDKRLSEWTSDINGMIRRYDRDKYLFVLEEKDFQYILEQKFTILDSVRSIQSLEGINATLSIGVGKDGESPKEKFGFASLALEMALSRGGDQVVIKNKYNFDFYGGMSKEVEKRTKVKSRVMANALNRLIRDSSQVFIMGHKMSDIDCVGAAVGMVCATRQQEQTARIVIDRQRTLAGAFLDRIGEIPEYTDVFITPEEAMLMADNDTLLIVVDTNRPDMVESEPLLQSINRVAVIDHHRRAAQYIENCAVNMHEPYASSACELVAELLQYMVPNRTILRAEAECLMAGIYLDTKGFTVKTGVRTFEASAYLRRAGADTVEVKKLFQNSFEGYMNRQSIISQARTLQNGVVIAITDNQVDRAIAAQAADELLNIMGVSASIVAFMEEDKVVVSARSLGSINVQIIMEKIGGGGNLTAAGAQLTGYSPKQVEYMIIEVIDNYFKENEQKDNGKGE